MLTAEGGNDSQECPISSPEVLAKTLKRLGYRDPSNPDEDLDTAALAQTLEWAFAMDETRPFLDWICEALGDDGGRNDTGGHRAGWRVLTEEQVTARQRAKKHGRIERDNAPFPAKTNTTPDTRNPPDDEADSEKIAKRDRVLQDHTSRMRETLQREEMRFKQVKLEKEKMERKLRDVELEISNLSLKCDAILSGTLESLNDWDQKLYSPEPDKRQFWCQYGQEIEEVSAQEDELLRYWKAKHSDLFTEGATEMQHPLLPNEPFPEKISELQFQIPDHLQREMKRLRTVMPLARKELLDSELQQLYTKLKAGSTVPDGDTRSQSGINDSAIPQHVAENGHDCSDLQEELNRLCEIDLPRIWNETAEYEVRLPIVEEYTKAIENDFTRLVETSQLLEKEMSEQGARREILESALRVESEYLRERNVTEVALLQLLKERDTTVKAIHHGATNGMQSAQHHTPDEAARIVMKAMAKILDLPADQDSTVASLLPLIQASIARTTNSRERLDQTINRHLHEEIGKRTKVSNAYLDNMYEHAVTALPLLAPKEVYDLENKIQDKTGELSQKLRQAQQSLENIQQPLRLVRH